MKNATSFFLTLKVLLLVTVPGYAENNECPPPEDIAPCTCTSWRGKGSLYCAGISDDNILKEVFLHSKGYSFREVLITFSRLKYLPEDMFDNAEVSELYIHNSTFNALFDAPPPGLQHLYKIHIENTKITEISHWELFEPLTDLKLLTIYYNYVEKIDSEFVKYVTKDINQLTMYGTGTKEITPGAFVKFTKFNKIEIDGGKLRHLSRDMFPQPFNVSVLYFQDNEITSIPDDLFTNMPNLLTVGLRNNFLKVIPEAAFDGRTSIMQFLFLEGNPLRCDCSLLWLVKSQPKDLTGSCATPIRMHDRELRHLSPKDFKC